MVELKMATLPSCELEVELVQRTDFVGVGVGVRHLQNLISGHGASAATESGCWPSPLAGGAGDDGVVRRLELAQTRMVPEPNWFSRTDPDRWHSSRCSDRPDPAIRRT